MISNNHIKRFYMELWNDTWGWLKPLIVLIAGLIVILSVSFGTIVGIVYTGIGLGEWLTGDEGLFGMPGSTILLLGFAPYVTLAALYFILKYFKNVWNRTANIIDHGIMHIPDQLIEYANSIKLDNYKTNTPAEFQKHNSISNIEIQATIANIANVDVTLIDWVFFSVCQGAEPHIDLLGDNFEDTTYAIPIILPTGKSVITAEHYSLEVELNHVYEFDHTKMHSMELEDTESGCVVIMAAIKRMNNEDIGKNFI